jgi:hypothetical protein
MRENPKSEIRNPKQAPRTESRNPKRDQGRRRRFGPESLRISDLSRISALCAVGLGILLAGGCASQPQTLQVCPGKATAAEALRTLATRAQHAVPVWANGQAVLTYHVPNRKKPERHSLTIDLRFDPPTRIYLQGNLTVVQKAVVIGSNDEKFWLALRPKEISSYYIGRWEDVQGFEGLVMSPRVVLEAVGLVIEPGAESNAVSWTLENKGPYDILTRRDEAGRMAKRVHVYACDYSVHKIEYFDHDGKIVAVAQLGEYEPVVEGFRVPTRIDVVSARPDGRKDSLVIDMGPVKTKPFTEQQRQGLFSPPDAGRFEHVYHYEDGQWVPE